MSSQQTAGVVFRYVAPGYTYAYMYPAICMYICILSEALLYRSTHMYPAIYMYICNNHLTASANAVKIKRMQPDVAHLPAMNQFTVCNPSKQPKR